MPEVFLIVIIWLQFVCELLQRSYFSYHSVVVPAGSSLIRSSAGTLIIKLKGHSRRLLGWRASFTIPQYTIILSQKCKSLTERTMCVQLHNHDFYWWMFNVSQRVTDHTADFIDATDGSLYLTSLLHSTATDARQLCRKSDLQRNNKIQDIRFFVAMIENVLMFVMTCCTCNFLVSECAHTKLAWRQANRFPRPV